VKAVFVSSPIDGIDKPHAASVLGQKWLPPKTGECQGVGIGRVIVTLAGLAMWHERLGLAMV
jgi:hypothetical protein